MPSPWPPDTSVVALYTFSGTSPEDLPFKSDDILTITKATKDPRWYRARHGNGNEGLIPANYVTVSSSRSEMRRKEVKLQCMPWFHGKITREEAERLLEPRPDGLYLVRESTNYPGDYTLCVCFQAKVEHYRVILRKEDNKLTIDEEEEFNNLFELIEHYQQDADGLCTQLIEPLAKLGLETIDTVDTLKDFQKAGWTIDIKDLRLGKSLGKGEFGDVLLATLEDKQVAVKRLNNANASHIQQFLAEASVMTSLRHTNLVKLLGIVVGNDEDGPTMLVTEYVSKGNLVDYLRSRGRNVITRKDQINFACDACSGMKYLESKKIVHRDLAARNILIDDDGTAKVSDFGLALIGSKLHAGLEREPGKLPIKWTAPEALRNNVFTVKSDVWSFGILLWELYSFGRVPYPRIPLADVVRHVESGYRMESPEGCPERVYDLMKNCWHEDPQRRRSFEQILEELKKEKHVTS